MEDRIVVFTAKMAKKLLRMGYTIVDIKQDKLDEDGKRSVFFFRNENDLESAIKSLADK